MLNLSPPTYASPELSPSLGGDWRGRIDRFDPLSGIEGWAASINDSGMRVEIELLVGDAPFALARTGLARPDVDRHLSPAARSGFRFEPEIFGRLARLSDHRRARPVRLLVAQTGVELLPPAGRAPLLGELLADWRTATLARLDPRERPRPRSEGLLERLSALRAEAAALRDQALRPQSDGEIGQVDLVYPAADGQVWFIGWMKRGVEAEFSALVSDRVKQPAGIAVLSYERSDLASNCVGVVALMDTAWTPAVPARDGFIHLGRQGQFHLRLTPATRLVRGEAFTGAFAQLQPAIVAGPFDAMGAVLASSTANWMPGAAAATGLVADGGIDRLLAVPGFGCLAEGWAVSPAKRIETFQLKIGDCVLSADPATTYFRARPDLGAVFGTAPSVTERAGFTAVFRGALPEGAAAPPLLRLVHEDGTAAVTKVDPKALRRFDPVSDGDELLTLFPSLRFEPFYPALQAALGEAMRANWRRPTVHRLVPASGVLVLRLPAEDDNLALVFDRAARFVAEMPAGTGLVFVGDTGATRAKALLRFCELAEGRDAPLSFVTLAHPDDATAELPWLLDEIGARRFVYAGRGLCLTAAGWRGARQSLERLGHGLDRFEIVDEDGRPDRIEGAVSGACFGWSAPALLDWSRTAPRFLRGTFGDGALPASPADRVVTGGALRLERTRASRLADMIDADWRRTGAFA